MTAMPKSPTATEPVRASDVLAAVFEGCDGLVECRALPSKAHTFVAIDAIATAVTFCESRREQDLYFGVATRQSSGDGSLANCQHLGAVFVDIDFKDTPEVGAQGRLEKSPCEPSIIVRSGGGLHVYWLLREPFDLSTEAAEARHLLRRLATHFGGDMAVAECARVLRVPNLLNHKYTPPRPVTVHAFDTSRRYNPVDFSGWLPMPNLHAATTEPVSLAEPIRAGRRNIDLYKTGRSLRVKNLAPDMVASTLRMLNARQCDPPLPDPELETLIRQVLGQPDRTDRQRSRRGGVDGEHGGTPASIHLTSASSIRVRPVRWLDEGRLALGTMGLLGGREGVGKSIYAYTFTAGVTNGTLPGVFHRKPRAVIVAATEDSWEHTIVPRLMAGGANLDLVYRVDVMTIDGTDTTLSLPRDLVALEAAVREVQAALILLDPLLSRLDATLDTHKDAEVRLALEPLVKLAAEEDVCVLGIIHVNKGTSIDPLNLLMGSRAFAAVARSVLFVMTDPADEKVRLLGQPKNNLGRTDLPTRLFRIVAQKVAEHADGPVWTAKLEWHGETDRSITEAVKAAAASANDRMPKAADWLLGYLTSVGGTQDSATVQQEGQRAGHSRNALHAARKRLGITSTKHSFPRKADWSLPIPVVPSCGGAQTTGPTGSSGTTGAPVDPVVPVDDSPQEKGTTGREPTQE